MTFSSPIPALLAMQMNKSSSCGVFDMPEDNFKDIFKGGLE